MPEKQSGRRPESDIDCDRGITAATAEELRRENERLRDRLEARRREREHIVRWYEDLLASAQTERDDATERTDVVWSTRGSETDDTQGREPRNERTAEATDSDSGTTESGTETAAVTPPDRSAFERLITRLCRK